MRHGSCWRDDGGAAIASLALVACAWAVAGLVPLAATAQDKPEIRVIVPVLSASAKAGKMAFDAHCAQCHGPNAAGSDKGPPLVHRIYEPGHHGDIAFSLAVKRGVRAHHWRFGDMPPQPQVSDREVSDIVRYVRELQRANGIQ